MPSVSSGISVPPVVAFVGALRRDDCLLAAAPEGLGMLGDVLGHRVGDDRGDGGADARQDAHPDADEGRAKDIPAVHRVVAGRDEHAPQRCFQRLESLLDVERVGEDLAEREHAEDHRQDVKAALEGSDPEGQPDHARRLVDAGHGDEHAEQPGGQPLEDGAFAQGRDQHQRHHDEGEVLEGAEIDRDPRQWRREKHERDPG